MDTYQVIQDDLHQRTGRTVSSCWIADVKRQLGFPMRYAPNRIDPRHPTQPCPPAWFDPIADALWCLGLEP